MGILNDRLEKLLPYVRGFKYDDETLTPRISLLFPILWKIDQLIRDKIVVHSGQLNPNSQAIIIGFTDKNINEDGIDYLFDKIESQINFNEQQEKKKELLSKKIKELEIFINHSSLDDVEKLQILTPELMSEEIITKNPISSEINLIDDISVPSEEISNQPIEIIDSEILYNPNMDLPSMPDIIHDIENYKQ